MAQFTLNGKEVEVGAHPHLLAALREELDVTSPKDGCSPSGQCGCCTVLIDGKASVSCQISLEKAAGKSITTLEGFDASERERFAAAFAATGALQCGFCTPGILVRVKALIDKKGSDLTRDDAARYLGAHLCRCTGYSKILDAVEVLAAGRVPEAIAPGGIGSRGIKYESVELALGDRDYVDDIRVPGMLHGALRLADHARADVLRIDTAAARALPGVEAVFTAADVPGELRVGIIHTDWPVFIPEGGRTSYLGDVLAIVVADSRETAREASKLVDITYQPLRPITDASAAIDDPEDAVWQLEGNVLSRSVYARGDVDAALAGSVHTVHEVFQTQRVEHAFLEPESTVAVPGPNGTLKVFSGGQGAWDDRNQIASVLGDPGRAGRRGAGLERRRLRGQGGHVQPGPDGPCRLAAEEGGEVHVVARGVVSRASETSPDPDGVLGRVRRRRQAYGPEGTDGRGLRAVRVGRHEGPRARRRPRVRPVSPARHRRRVDRSADEQPGVRCLSWLRRQPGPVRDGRRHRSPGG